MSNQPEKMQPRLTLIPPSFLASLADLLYKGDQKHEPMGWMKQSLRQRLDSLGRHYLALCAGEDTDPEWGHQHALHLAANAMMIWWQIEQGYAGSGLDQRRFRAPSRVEDPGLETNIAATLDAVVPSRTLRGSMSKLREEAAELATEVERAVADNRAGASHDAAALAAEAADVLICLVDVARLSGTDLVAAVEEKLRVLRSRDQQKREADKLMRDLDLVRGPPEYAEERFGQHGPPTF